MSGKMFVLSVICLSGLGIAGISGCDETTTIKEEKTVTTPEGTTKTTTERTIEKSGENPPDPAH